jgi:hypothetical protein
VPILAIGYEDRADAELGPGNRYNYSYLVSYRLILNPMKLRGRLSPAIMAFYHDHFPRLIRTENIVVAGGCVLSRC